MELFIYQLVQWSYSTSLKPICGVVSAIGLIRWRKQMLFFLKKSSVNDTPTND